MKKDKWVFFEDSWNEHDGSPIPFKKEKRFRSEFKRNKIKNNRGRSQGGGAAYKGGEGSDY